MVDYNKLGEINFSDRCNKDTINQIIEAIKSKGFDICIDDAYMNPHITIMKKIEVDAYE
jgi:hypothetical protein